MMLLAMISPIELGVLLLVGYVGYRVVNRCGGVRPAGGFLMKTLGVVAVIAGIGVLATRGDRNESHDETVTVSQDADGHALEFPEGFDRGDFLHGAPFQHDEHGHVRTVPSGLIIVLGSGLIILGAMLFGRDRTRPFALKALTFLGVGAILFSVVSFFGEPPRAEPTVRMVHAERHRVEHEQRIAKRPTRPTRAKRPSLRPDRPSSESESEAIEDFLPPRAGEIPVAAELAKAETQAAREKPADDVKVVEPQVEEVEVAEPKIPEPKIEAPSAPEPPPTPAEEPAPAEEAAPADVPAPTEAPQPAAKKPAEEPVPANEAPAPEATPAAEQPEAAKPAEDVAEPAAEPAATSAPSATEETTSVAAVAKPAEEKSEVQPAPQPEPTKELTATIVPSKPRPSWVDRAPGLSDGVYGLVVSSGPYSSVPECQRALNDEIASATNHYINEYLGDDNAASLVNLPVSFSQQVIKKQEYAETIESPSVGRMHQLHARLEFDDHARNVFQQRWRTAVVQDRLWYTGGGAALVLALLATFYGYLKLDLKTDTPHKGRLQLAATLVALLVAAGALLARWAVPF